jgi:hypothetical protein
MDIADGRLTRSAAAKAAPDILPVRITLELVKDRRASDQEEWDTINKRCISWIHNTIAANLRVHVLPEMTAFEVYSALRTVCESTTHQLQTEKMRKWLNYVYKGSEPMDFVIKWQELRLDCLSASPYAPCEPEMQIMVFITAAYAYAPVNQSLSTYVPNPKQRFAKNLEDVFRQFVRAENLRLACTMGNPGPD